MPGCTAGSPLMLGWGVARVAGQGLSTADDSFLMLGWGQAGEAGQGGNGPGAVGQGGGEPWAGQGGIGPGMGQGVAHRAFEGVSCTDPIVQREGGSGNSRDSSGQREGREGAAGAHTGNGMKGGVLNSAVTGGACNEETGEGGGDVATGPSGNYATVTRAGAEAEAGGTVGQTAKGGAGKAQPLQHINPGAGGVGG